MNADTAIPERLRMLAQRTDAARLPPGQGHVSPTLSSQNGGTPTPRHTAPLDPVSSDSAHSNASEAWIRASEPNLGFTGSNVDDAMRGVFSERFAPMTQFQEDMRGVSEPAYGGVTQASDAMPPPPPQLARHNHASPAFGLAAPFGRLGQEGSPGPAGEPGVHVPAYATLPRTAMARNHDKSTNDSSAWLVRGSQLAASIIAGAAIIFALYKWIERNILTPKQQNPQFKSTEVEKKPGNDSSTDSDSDDIESPLGVQTRAGVAVDGDIDRAASQDDTTTAPGPPANYEKPHRRERSRRRGARKYGRESKTSMVVDSNFREFDGTETENADESTGNATVSG